MFSLNRNRGGSSSSGEASPFRDDLANIEVNIEEGEAVGNPVVLAPGSNKAGWRQILPNLFTSSSESDKKAAENVDIDTKIVHKYVFTCGDRCRELTLAHAEAIWYIKMDSQLIMTKSHSNTSFRTFRTSTEFQIPGSSPGDSSLEPSVAKMTMEWIPLSLRWQYTLFVGDIVVPPCWTKGSGSVEGSEREVDNVPFALP